MSNLIDPLITPYLKDKMSMLVVGDVHENSTRFVELCTWLKDHNARYDVIACTGDFANYDFAHPLKNKEDPREVEDRTKAKLAELTEYAQCVVFVPGNHEAPRYYSEHSELLPERVIYLHGKAVKLCEGLILAGAGGCPPGYMEGDPVISGVPFTSDRQMGAFLAESFADLVSLINRQNEPNQESASSSSAPSPDSSAESSVKVQHSSSNELNVKDSVVFVTHVGPLHSATSFGIKHKTKRTTTGSLSLSQFLLCKKHSALYSRTALLVHGHSHFGTGFMKSQIVHKALERISRKEGWKEREQESERRGSESEDDKMKGIATAYEELEGSYKENKGCEKGAFKEKREEIMDGADKSIKEEKGEEEEEEELVGPLPPIFNPGALTYGKFGSVVLRREESGWKIETITLLNLPLAL
ncbi:uncharacterized protein MONOS_13635 [Monocercomonoides exilis]|uniref:uncharacterized protein n=1 Tax=Monocercomonoides exilis TaxID=2049356 RepID=UPI00355A891E|nr:hypothetical protein MONOS_18379 [Monocercomonoides exilis]KAH7822599.1 hypothetical protein MONOS_13635 [Monocercomonoides exilis]|eukprot:MONOS_13635.1-p1 / transcript=MONOS_13635.1 / gene=MONOS_13635 / organism=Monocercomonoides_exilis_PA203 / gene_product=unspecified product / transcript_product=unspecified product / location=Mono_scaffold00856:13002-14311(+) / protein_length=413 / sequence_SO=supercontig / SO=protein_coding / is_pseudo=false